METRRPLKSSDPMKFVIPLDTKFDMGIAVNTRSNDITREHNKENGFSMFLSSNGTYSFAQNSQMNAAS